MKLARTAWMALVCLLLVSTLRGEDALLLPKPSVVPEQTTLDKQFEKTMSGATLQGTFTVSGRADGQPLKEEKYTISKVAKLKDDFWLFNTRIQYGKHDATIALPLEVKWAGDTAVITLSDVAVPGFGTFTCRVLVFHDQYAGTWSGGNHGGHMFGKITHD